MMNEKKVVAGFEMMMMVVSLFAFCYFVGFSEEMFSLASAVEDEGSYQKFLDKFDVDESSLSGYSTSFGFNDPGCCLVSSDSQICGTAAPSACATGSPFLENSLCSEVEFCKKGCCYDDGNGTYDKNVLELSCKNEWVNDPNCNLPGAKLGCCVLGSETIFETEGQCTVDSLAMAIGDEATVDWNRDVGEAACLFLASENKEGACVTEGGSCKFVREEDCIAYDGDFSEDYLCTAEFLNTSCKMTEQTQCVDGKDGVYFVDSCGNVANVYDSARAKDVKYWEKIIEEKDLCGSTDLEGGNGGSPSCGNCNRFAGGICSPASEDNFNVDLGDFYCKDTSCMFDGKKYRNGESWCVYDGAIGDGNDVVGSRHWKYVCSQGTVQIEPCADYRNQICVQTDSAEVGGNNVNFNNAVCIANNWRECVSLNSKDKDAMSDCQEALNCRVEDINISDDFNFNVCLPKYPAGFAFDDDRYSQTADSLCGMATMNCSVTYEPKTWGGCKLVANEECLSETFAQEMNEFCRGLGDCGGSVNIAGEYSESYSVLKDGEIDEEMLLSESWILKLIAYATPVPGQFAGVEDYSEYLEAAGVLGRGDVAPDGEEGEESLYTVDNAAKGVGGLGTALMWAAGLESVKAGGLGAIGTASPAGAAAGSTYMSAFGGAAIGAGIGMTAGSMLAERMELSPGGSMLMAIGGAMVGAVAGYAVMAGLAAIGPVGWAIAIIGVVLMIIASFFGGDDCDPIEVAF
jgi:hypothetical protein